MAENPLCGHEIRLLCRLIRRGVGREGVEGRVMKDVVQQRKARGGDCTGE